MRAKTILSGFAAKFAAILLVFSMFVTGCYKDDGLDVNKPGDGTTVIPDAAYSISGAVTDIETGEAVNVSEVVASAGTVKLAGNGSFNVSITKAQVPAEGVVVNLTIKASGYKDAVRSVFIEQIPDGSTVVYPVNVVMKKDVEPVKYVDVVYELGFVTVNTETREVIEGLDVTVDGTPDADGNYAAGEYIVRTEAVADKYYASTTVISLPEIQVKEGENNVVKRVVMIEVAPVPEVVEPEPEPEFIRIYGEVVDKRGILAEAQIIRLEGSDLEPVYNADHFSFTINREDAAAKYRLVAEVRNANETGVISASAVINVTDAESYNVLIQYPFDIENGKEVVNEGDDATGTVTPDINEDGIVEETVTNIMSDGTTIVLEEGTETNLGDQTLILVRNTSEEEQPSDESVVIRSYVGLPDGTTFNPGLKVMFTDSYGGQLGDNFVLQYLGKDGSWSTDSEGSVSLAGNVYTMDVRHFSTFRASFNLVAESESVDTDSLEVIEINRMNNTEEPLENFELKYNGQAGSRYADYAKLEADVKAGFSNANAQAVVLSAIKNLCPEAELGFSDKEYVGLTTIPAWTLLNTVNVKTVKTVTTYTFEVSGRTISFDVETIKSVEVSATEKENMTHIGHSHSHGHGHGDDLNNAGGGIIVNE